MEQRTGSKLGKQCVKAAYCHPAYLTYMQSTSCEMPGWMRHKLESRRPGEISITSDRHTTPLLWRKARSLLMKVKENNEKSWLKTQHSKNDHHIQSHHFMANRWGNNGNSDRLLFSWALKSLQMVTAVMKLKDACSLEEKL